jgi:F0F1-type ATP synthase membrane subunit c/vacuolar-type H+-ATPase subunit K
MDFEAAKVIGAGIAVFSLWGVGLGLGNLFSTLVSSIARNPQAKNQILPVGILGFAMIEAVALFALVVAILILFK